MHQCYLFFVFFFFLELAVCLDVALVHRIALLPLVAVLGASASAKLMRASRTLLDGSRFRLPTTTNSWEGLGISTA